MLLPVRMAAGQMVRRCARERVWPTAVVSWVRVEMESVAVGAAGSGTWSKMFALFII
jgi:hypothetical protein